MGPGSAPAECGPTRNPPPASSQAMDPPPAPMVWTSTEGSFNGSPAISEERVSSGIPSRISAISVDVPPISKDRSEEHTSELQSRFDLVCRLLLEKKKISKHNNN